MSRADITRRVLGEFAARRHQNEAERERRIAEVAARDPDIPVLVARDHALLMAQARLFITAPERAEAAMIEARQSAAQKRALLIDKLRALGLPDDYLEPIFNCAACRDTGFSSEGRVRCHCLSAALTEGAYAGAQLTDRERFETFDASIFPDDKEPGSPSSQRTRMLAARDLCRRYADALPHTDKLNIVLMGASGLGKTFLLNSIARRALDRGQDALKMTAFQMFSAMRDCHMGQDDGRAGFFQLIAHPLLLLDDIGTEPMFNNITREYLFTLLNERLSARRPTVIATNLTMGDVRERYGERVFSRMMADREAHLIRLTGRDIRLMKAGG